MTRSEVLDRLQAFVQHAARVKTLKDQLAYAELHGRDPDVVQLEVTRHDELVAEIRAIYSDNMLPIMEEIAAFVGAKQR